MKDGEALLVSRYGLDAQPYHTALDGHAATYEMCTVRVWLNDTFLNAAFDKEERQFVKTKIIVTDKNPQYNLFQDTYGNVTQDKIFLLSIVEANHYFSSDAARVCKPTEYAMAQGCYKSQYGNCLWWLRTPGTSLSSPANVKLDGSIDYYGQYLGSYTSFAIRPALWIALGW